jgi:hypothetical protein
MDCDLMNVVDRRTVRLHLDTSDYAAMYIAAPGTPFAKVYDELHDMVKKKTLQIGLSYHVVFELLQRAEPKYRDDRLARARVLVQLCSKNAFPYPTDLGQGYRFSTDGLWIPRVEVKQFEIENLVHHAKDAIARELNLRRHDRRAFAKRGNFVNWVRSDPKHLLRLPRPVPFPAFVESGDLRRYVLGEMSRKDANSKLQFYLTDPVTVYNTWFDYYEMDNPIVDRRDQLARHMTVMRNELQAMLDDHANLRSELSRALSEATTGPPLSVEGRKKLMELEREVKQFGKEILSPEELTANVSKWREFFGADSALVAAQIFYAFHHERRDFKQSDAIDLIHALYLPHTDLWRGDRAFSTLLINNKVNFCERIVPSLLDLPARIEALRCG